MLRALAAAALPLGAIGDAPPMPLPYCEPGTTLHTCGRDEIGPGTPCEGHHGYTCLPDEDEPFFGACATQLREAAAPPPPPGRVLVLRDPRSMNLGDRANLLQALSEMDPSADVESVDFVKGQLRDLLLGRACYNCPVRYSTVIIYSLDNCYMDTTGYGDREALASFVSGGGVLIVTGDWRERVESSRVPDGYSCDLDGTTNEGRMDERADSAAYLLGETFGWTDLRQATDSISTSIGATPVPFVRTAAAEGTVFASGPAELSGAVTYYSGLLIRRGDDGPDLTGVT